MKSKAIILTVLLSGCLMNIKSRPDDLSFDQEKMRSIYDIPVVTIEGEDTKLDGYKGKKMLIVNVASECGFTPQYADLQELHKQYGDKVAILGFPANNFGGQEPGSNQEIQTFCQKNYGVSFQMFEKISVKGGNIHPLYSWLGSKEQNGWNDKLPNWNFCKYLIDENGQLLKFYSSRVNPMSDEIVEAILN